MNNTLLLSGCAVLGCAAIALHLATRQTDHEAQAPMEAQEPAEASLGTPAVMRAAPDQAAIADDGPELPPEFYQKLPPRGRVALTLPKGIKSGIRCPDGSYLPLLNGVAWAPKLNRNSLDGPLPPVVAKVTDYEGYEWYEHADGSQTTVRMQGVTRNGEHKPEPVTTHTAPVGEEMFKNPVVGPRNGSNQGPMTSGAKPPGAAGAGAKR